MCTLSLEHESIFSSGADVCALFPLLANSGILHLVTESTQRECSVLNEGINIQAIWAGYASPHFCMALEPLWHYMNGGIHRGTLALWEGLSFDQEFH